MTKRKRKKAAETTHTRIDKGILDEMVFHSLSRRLEGKNVPVLALVNEACRTWLRTQPLNLKENPD